MLTIPDPVSVMLELRGICAAFGLRCAGVMSCLPRLATHTSTASPVRPAPEAAGLSTARNVETYFGTTQKTILSRRPQLRLEDALGC